VPGTAKFAGYPADKMIIKDCREYYAEATYPKIGYRIDCPKTQATGIYSGNTTITAVAN